MNTMKDHIKPRERLQFENEYKKDWYEVIKGGLFILLFVGLSMLIYGAWR